MAGEKVPRMMRQLRPGGVCQRAVAVGGLLLLLATGCANTGDGAATTTPELPPTEAPAAAPGAIWPSTGEAQLDRLHALANRGQRPDLLDPVAVARVYVTTALPPEAKAAPLAPGLVVARFKATSPKTGEVAVHGPRMSPSTVFLHRYAAPAKSGPTSDAKPIWYVQGLGSEDLAVLDVDYNGARLSGALVPTRTGRITMRASTLDGQVLAERATAAVKGRLVDIDVAAPDQPGLVFTAVLTADDGITALRVFRLGPPTGG